MCPELLFWVTGWPGIHIQDAIGEEGMCTITKRKYEMHTAPAFDIHFSQHFFLEIVLSPISSH